MPSYNNFNATFSRYVPELQIRFSSNLSRVMEGAGVGDTLLGTGRGVSRALMAGAVANLAGICLVAGLLVMANTPEASLQFWILLAVGQCPKPLSCGLNRVDCWAYSFIYCKMWLIFMQNYYYSLFWVGVCLWGQNLSQNEFPDCIKSARNWLSSCSEYLLILSYFPCIFLFSSWRYSFYSWKILYICPLQVGDYNFPR